ncbi:MAG: hypothetical protein M0Z67_09425, partial [Nitrospiraceae bacterium]|nr:hypothetical protein [Nitrospiraceae bacterium]
IPFKPVIQGGKIGNFQIERIWIESLIPYGNYRGAIIDDSEKIWLGLDTSIKVKDYTYSNPIDIFQQSAIGNQFSAIRDEYLGAVQTQTPLEYMETKLTADGYQLSDLMLTKTLVPEILKILPASLQFMQKTITHEYTEIPDELKHKVRFTATDKDNNELFTTTLDTMELSNKQVALSYEPETVEDQQIIDSYGGLDNTPVYLVRLRPVLKVDGERMIVGRDGLPMGADYDLTIELISPNGTERITNTQITGNMVAIGIVGGKVTPSGSPLPQGGDTVTPSPLGGEGGGEGDKDAEELLYEEAMHYIDRWNKAEDELASLLHLAVSRPVPTVAMVGGVIDVTYLLDMPHGFEWKGVFVDASLRAINLVGTNGGSVTPSGSPLPQEGEKYRQRIFMQLSALQGSVLEHRIFEDDFGVDSISTAKMLQIEGAIHELPILDKTNIDTVLPTLDLVENIKEDITNVVNQGLVVRIPDSEITYKDWTGIGYIKEDPSTGEAGYMLSGMLASSSPDLSGIAGGMTAVSPDRWRTQNLRSLLSDPFTPRSENKKVLPLGVVIAFPFDGMVVASSAIDVEGLVSDPGSSVEVNGVKAAVSQDGRFIAKGVLLTEGSNHITAGAKDPLGQEAAYTVTVERTTQDAPPLMVSIVSPENGDVINRPSVIVKGTITTDAKEVSIKVNGVLAEVYGNQFVANGITLTEGDNTIVAYASDTNGATGRAEVTVKAITTGPYISLSANITSGIPALITYFAVATELPNPVMTYEMDFEGDGVMDYTGAAFEDISFTYTAEGIYYPTLKVTDDQGNIYSDTIPVVVLNKKKLDALLKEKWEGMKAALLAGDMEKGLSYIIRSAQSRYREAFQVIIEELPHIVSAMQPIELIYLVENAAKYRINRVQDVDGQQRTFSYYIYFTKDAIGNWKIDRF